MPASLDDASPDERRRALVLQAMLTLFAEDAKERAAALALRTGQGFLDREHDAFIDYFADAEDWFAARNACYAHAWDDSGTRLLVTGGPLAYGLKGCYVGVWR